MTTMKKLTNCSEESVLLKTEKLLFRIYDDQFLQLVLFGKNSGEVLLMDSLLIF